MTSQDTPQKDESRSEPADRQAEYKPPTEEANTSRLEAFSDGVFAVAITLLVLDIHVPGGDDVQKAGNLLEALRAQGGTYIAYLTSFIVIGIIWINHHAMFRDIRRSTHMLLILNLLLLLCVSLIPFPTALLGQYIAIPSESYTATAVYSGVMLAMAIAFVILGLYVWRAGLVRAEADPQVMWTRIAASVFGTLLYAISFIFAFFNVAVSIGIYAFVALIFLLLNGINPTSLNFNRQRRGSSNETT